MTTETLCPRPPDVRGSFLDGLMGTRIGTGTAQNRSFEFLWREETLAVGKATSPSVASSCASLLLDVQFCLGCTFRFTSHFTGKWRAL
jgi:hypothetical protein